MGTMIVEMVEPRANEEDRDRVDLGGVTTAWDEGTIGALFDFQRQYEKALGIDVSTVESLRYFILCAVDELMELLHEVPSWKKHRPEPSARADKEKVAEECADVLVFLINVMIGTGVGPGEFEAAIDRVVEKNRRRLAEGVNKTSSD